MSENDFRDPANYYNFYFFQCKPWCQHCLKMNFGTSLGILCLYHGVGKYKIITSGRRFFIARNLYQLNANEVPLTLYDTLLGVHNE